MTVDWDKKIIKLFKDFADEELQRRSWFGIGPEVSSAVEMCCWIDDVDVLGWCNENETRICGLLFFAINDFLSDIDNLPNNLDDWQVFSSLEWVSIRLKSSVIRDLLEQQLT